MKTAIITTTINVPVLLKEYVEDARKHGHGPDSVGFITAGDKKTPDESKQLCEQIQEESGYTCEYMDPDAQDRFLADMPELDDHLPWNCVQRRNVAILKAWLDGYDVIVTIDDDNYIHSPDYIKGHCQVGQRVRVEAFSNERKWLNICDFLEDKNQRDYFPRGYAVSERIFSRLPMKFEWLEAKVVVNGGFWLGDPDIDAVTRLAEPIDAVRYTRSENFALAPGTWSPFNSQNTAIAREAIPAYFLSPFVGRFDDIWGGYFLKRIADHFGDLITFGFPLVRQDRNDHNLWHDLDIERMGMLWTEKFIGWLESASLTGKDYNACTVELVEHLASCVAAEKELPDEYRTKLTAYTDGYRIWANTLKKLTS